MWKLQVGTGLTRGGRLGSANLAKVSLLLLGGSENILLLHPDDHFID